MVRGPIDEFCESLRAELHAQRLRATGELDLLKALVEELGHAKEADLVERWAKTRGVAAPQRRVAATPSVVGRLVAAARQLQQPEELRPLPSPRAPEPATREVEAGPRPPALAARHAREIAGSEAPVPTDAAWPALARSLAQAPLVVVGGASDAKRRSLPESLRSQVEWVDTSREGSHAIGNLAQRIRQRRVGALIILDGLVGHKHSEPLVSAARGAKVPTAYANKGGSAALTRALTQLEKMLGPH